MFLLHLLVSHAALSYSPSGARLALGRVARAAAARMDEVACDLCCVVIFVLTRRVALADS